ncbi:class I tRNA ligase family protein [Streptacidiphilus griseoplanus]|uniref:class I tRNA ligase family protein n=1 Tax=Peterkaempfera griseoplana TaxID=66896 RepID=UPI0006E2174A|nr:class I tRNA ligase family protein [Peterkaempfera griseoplana]
MTHSSHDAGARHPGQPADDPGRSLDERPVLVFSTPPTPNGDLHLGHLSGPYLGADVFVRFQRMHGVDAWHLTGSDDYQSYVVDTAALEGGSPAETAARYSAEILATLRLMDIEPDQYTATGTAEGYPDGLRRFFSRIVDSGRPALAEGPALFDEDSGRYLYEVDVAGLCPWCGQSTGGNICEDCGEPNSCADIHHARATRSPHAPRRGTAVRWSLPLHESAEDVAAHHRLGRVPARLRELAERIFRRDRVDIALSHPARWGVPAAEPGTDGQVIWVWPEMAYGFLYGIQTLGRRLGRDWSADRPRQDWKIVHFFGYDNSFYHAVLYPALYRLAFPQWNPDIDYHPNEFYLLDGEKFSTSRRHAVWGKEILSPESVDAVRYHLSLTRPEGRRTNFSRGAYDASLRDTLIGRWQAWLNDLGTRIDTRHGGEAPDAGVWTPEHRAFLDRLRHRLAEVTGALGQDGFSLNLAAEALTGIVADAQRFHRTEGRLADSPALADESRTAVALELAAAQLLARCATPLMPRFAGRLAAALGAAAPVEWPRAVELVKPGTRITLADQEFFTPAVAAR